MCKTLVLYVFHVFNKNVNYFINNSIFYDENVDFIMISNDKKNSIDVPMYVKTFYRDNNGYDFGGWSEALLKDDLYLNYDKFIFVNSTAIGPFISSNYKGKWTDIYLNELKDNIKLFGSTINNCNKPYLAHVQSYIFAMDKITLEYLISCGIFSLKYVKTKKEAIRNKEILMSRKIIENGWNIGSFLRQYKDVDFTFSKKSPKEYNIIFHGDLMYEKYRGKYWNIFELVFVKGNRINTDHALKLYEINKSLR